MASEGVFQQQIKCMMYTFGDAKNPNPESMFLVEDFTRQQLRDIVSHAARVSSMRDGRMLRTEDVMFLLRKDKDQLRSLIRYVEMKMLTKRARNSQKRFDDDCYTEPDLGERSDTHISQKTLKLFDDFLTPLQKTELRLRGVDDSEAQRLKHYDELTESMDTREYIEYAEQRSTSLYKNLTKFKEWVGVEELTSLTVNNEVLDVLGHLGHETVRKLVELSLQVRCDMESKTQTPRPWPLSHPDSGQEPNLQDPPSSEQEGDNGGGGPFVLGSPPSSPPANILSSPHTTDTEVTSTLRRSARESRKRQRGAQQAPSAVEAEPPLTGPPPTKKRAPRAIRPLHIREAIRRLEQSHHATQVTPLWTHHSSSKYRKSLCL